MSDPEQPHSDDTEIKIEIRSDYSDTLSEDSPTDAWEQSVSIPIDTHAGILPLPQQQPPQPLKPQPVPVSITSPSESKTLKHVQSLAYSKQVRGQTSFAENYERNRKLQIDRPRTAYKASERRSARHSFRAPIKTTGLSPRVDELLAKFNFATLPADQIKIMRNAINRKDEAEIECIINQFNPRSWNPTYEDTVSHWDEALREKAFMHQELLDILNRKIQRYQTITMVMSLLMSAFVTSNFVGSESGPSWYKYTQQGITTGGTLLITLLTSLLKLKGYQERTRDIQRYLDRLNEVHAQIQGIFITPPDFRQDPVDFVSRTLTGYIDLILTAPKLTNSECRTFKEKYDAWNKKMLPEPMQFEKPSLGCCCLWCNSKKRLATKGSKFDYLATAGEHRSHYKGTPSPSSQRSSPPSYDRDTRDMIRVVTNAS